MKARKNVAPASENYDKKEFFIYDSMLLRYYGKGGHVVIPACVSEIADKAFRGCTSLTSVAIPKGTTYIGDMAFKGCTGLTSIAIPKRVESMGEFAFYGCTGLRSVKIPRGVKAISNNPFAACERLESIAVCKINFKYKSDGNCIIDRKTKELVAGCKSSVIPKYAASIARYAFCGAGFKEMTLPESIKSIGEFAFYLCSELTAITIPSSVTYIGEGAFNGCEKLTSIVIPQSVMEIGFKEEINDPYYKGIEPEEHRIIFGDCPSLKSVKLPERFRGQDLGISPCAEVVYY